MESHCRGGLDPGFLSCRGGGAGTTLSFGQNLPFGKIFSENCMEVKEIGPSSAPPPRQCTGQEPPLLVTSGGHHWRPVET